MKFTKIVIVSFALCLVSVNASWGFSYFNFSDASIEHVSDSTFRLRANFGYGGDYTDPDFGVYMPAVLHEMRIGGFNIGDIIWDTWTPNPYTPMPSYFVSGVYWNGGHYSGYAEAWMLDRDLGGSFGWDFYAKNFDRNYIELYYESVITFTGLNQDGQAVGGPADSYDGTFRVELPSDYVIPEPATVILLILGLGGIGAIKRIKS